MPESLRTGPDDLFADARVLACAAIWARRLKLRGITDIDADDLLNEAWRLAHARVNSPEIDHPLAFIRTVIKNAALMRIRRKTPIPSDPADLRIASLAAVDRSFVELEARMHLAETLRFLEQTWDEIWAGALMVFGRSERSPASIRAASVQAIEHLLLQDTGLDIDEILRASMAAADPWWRADSVLGEPIKTVIERRRKRLARDIHWISYIVLWVVLRWAHADHPQAQRQLAARHLAHLRLTAHESRSDSARAALQPHIDEVAKAAGLSADPGL